MAPSSVDYFMQILTRVIEHFQDLGVETRNDNGLEERVETAENDCTDNNSNDDLNAGVDIALTGGGLDGGLGRNDCLVELVLDGVDKLFHRLITSFFLKILVLFFVVGKMKTGSDFISLPIVGADYICCMV